MNKNGSVRERVRYYKLTMMSFEGKGKGVFTNDEVSRG